MEHIEKTVNVHDPLLDSVNVPLEGQYLWNVFWSLTGRMNFQEMKAYSELHGITFSPWEMETLLLMEASASKAIKEIIRG